MAKTIKTEEVLGDFIESVQSFKDKGGHLEPLSSIVTIHLYIEYLLNYLNSKTIAEIAKKSLMIIELIHSQ